MLWITGDSALATRDNRLSQRASAHSALWILWTTR